MKSWMYIALAGLGYYWYTNKLTPAQQTNSNQRNTGPITQQGVLPAANMGSKTQAPVNGGAAQASNLVGW